MQVTPNFLFAEGYTYILQANVGYRTDEGDIQICSAFIRLESIGRQIHESFILFSTLNVFCLVWFGVR